MALFLISQTWAAPDHAGVLAQNLQMANALRHSSVWPENISNASATMAQPLAGAYVAFLAASPSVDDRVSDLRPPAIFWAWGERHAGFLQQALPQDGKCDIGQASLTSWGPAQLEGNLTWTLGGRSIRQPLDGDGAEPLPMPAFAPADWAALKTIRGENGSSVLPNLTLHFDGEVKAAYVYHELKFEREEGGLAMGSGGKISDDYFCRLREKTEIRNYTREVSASASWRVEHGQPLWVLLQPAGREQLSWRPQAQVAILANRQEGKMTMVGGTSSLQSAEPAYENQSDTWGIVTIRRDGRALNTSSENGSLYSNSSFRFLQPLALDGENRTFAWQFYHHAWLDLAPGWSNLTAKFEDEFGNGWNQSWALDTRAGSGIALTQNKTQVVLTDGRMGAPALEKNNANGLESLYQVAGSDTVRPSQAAQNPPASMPALAALLPLAVVALIGYGVLARNR